MSVDVDVIVVADGDVGLRSTLVVDVNDQVALTSTAINDHVMVNARRINRLYSR